MGLEQDNIALLRRMKRPESERQIKTGRIGSKTTRVTINGTQQPNKMWVNDGRTEFVVDNWKIQYEPDVPVIVEIDPDTNERYIRDVDAKEATIAFGQALGAINRPDAPAEVIFEPVVQKRLKILRLTAAPNVSSFAVSVSPGWYRYNGTLAYFAGGTLDLASTFSSISSGKHRWVVVALDTTTGALTSATGAEVNAVVPLNFSDVPAVSLSAGQLALWAIDAVNGDTSLTSIWRERVYAVQAFLSFSDFVLNLTGLTQGDVLTYDSSEFVNKPLFDSSYLVKHELGGLEADVSAYEGVPIIEGGSTSELKINRTATTDPGTSDDSTGGYSVGSLWINITDDKAFQCLDASAGSAVWRQFTGTMAAQNANSVNIDGGAIDGTAIGANSASTGEFTTIDASGAVTFDAVLFNGDMRSTSTFARLRHFPAAGDTALLDLDAEVVNGTEEVLVRYLRDCNTSGNKDIRYHNADGTSAIRHKFNLVASGDTYVCNGMTGDFGFFTDAPGTGVDINNDLRVRGYLRMDANHTLPSSVAGFDVNSSGEVFVQDTGNNRTQLSSHPTRQTLLAFGLSRTETEAILARGSRYFIREISGETNRENLIDVVGMAMYLEELAALDATQTQKQFVFSRNVIDIQVRSGQSRQKKRRQNRRNRITERYMEVLDHGNDSA